jgi:hypothetical protein
LSEQSNSSSVTGGQLRKYGIAGLAVHLAGFALGFVSIGLVFAGVIDIESGIAALTPFADLLYGLGLIASVAVAARAGVPIKYLLVAGAVIGIGLFYKTAPHEIHIASGIGFGVIHNGHLVLGMILIAISVAAITGMSFAYTRSRRLGDRAG